MVAFHQPWFWSLALIHLIGVVGLVAARLSVHSSACVHYQRLFLICFFVVASATMGLLLAGTPWWITCGTLLSVMTVGGIMDCRPETRPTVW